MRSRKAIGVTMKTTAPLQPGHYYHVYNRGNNREDLFREECNYRYFLQLYTRHVLPIAITFAYCLMRNHFHFLVRIRETTLQTSQVFAKHPAAKRSGRNL